MIDNALVEPGRQLEVTEQLAPMLGLGGTVELDWRFASRGERVGCGLLDPVRGLGSYVNQQTRKGSRRRR